MIEGANGTVITAPSYNCTSNDDIVGFCLDLENSSNILFDFYNNPPRVETDLSTPNLLRIAEHSTFDISKGSTTHRRSSGPNVCS